MTDPISSAISALALSVSLVTAWLTLFRRGKVNMTQPTVVFFGPDTPRSREEPILPKVFLRTLLFATSKRGRIIQSMHVTLRRGNAEQIFSVWVYGDDRLVRGSGVFVSETGIAANHHFLAPPDARSFTFEQGTYQLDVFAQLLGDKRGTHLFTQKLTLSREEACKLANPDCGVYFDWRPDKHGYETYVDRKPARPNEDFTELLRLMRGSRSISGS